MVSIYLEVEPVTQHIVSSGPDGEDPLAGNRLVNLLYELPGKCLVIPD